MVERNSDPDDFSGPLGNLLDGIQSKGVFLTDVTFYRARHVPRSRFTHVSQLGYPPDGKAPKDRPNPKGRLNGEGMSILYAAFSPSAAVVEICAKVGQIIAIAIIEELPGHANQSFFFRLEYRSLVPTRLQFAIKTKNLFIGI